MNISSKAEKFSHVATGLFNIAKIIALIAAAYWTVYQWNETIFPKESHEAFLRRAASRTDLKIRFSNVSYIHPKKQLEPKKSPIQAQNSLKPWFELNKALASPMDSDNSEIALILASCILSNAKDFPIGVHFTRVRLRSGVIQFNTSQLDSGLIAAIGLPITWHEEVELSPKSVIGSGNLKGLIVVETQGKVELPFWAGIGIKWPDCECEHFIEITVEMNIYAIDPKNGNKVPNSDKSKSFGYWWRVSEDSDLIFPGFIHGELMVQNEPTIVGG